MEETNIPNWTTIIISILTSGTGVALINLIKWYLDGYRDNRAKVLLHKYEQTYAILKELAEEHGTKHVHVVSLHNGGYPIEYGKQYRSSISHEYFTETGVKPQWTDETVDMDFLAFHKHILDSNLFTQELTTHPSQEFANFYLANGYKQIIVCHIPSRKRIEFICIPTTSVPTLSIKQKNNLRKSAMALARL